MQCHRKFLAAQLEKVLGCRESDCRVMMEMTTGTQPYIVDNLSVFFFFFFFFFVFHLARCPITWPRKHMFLHRVRELMIDPCAESIASHVTKWRTVKRTATRVSNYQMGFYITTDGVSAVDAFQKRYRGTFSN